jgi:hypothetical protein
MGDVPKLAAQRGNVQLHLIAAHQRHLEGLTRWVWDPKCRSKAAVIAELTQAVMEKAVADSEALKLGKESADRKKLSVVEFKGRRAGWQATLASVARSATLLEQAVRLWAVPCGL